MRARAVSQRRAGSAVQRGFDFLGLRGRAAHLARDGPREFSKAGSWFGDQCDGVTCELLVGGVCPPEILMHSSSCCISFRELKGMK